MAHFQINLLTPEIQKEEGQLYTRYVETTISEFYSQTTLKDRSSYCYTYDETYEEHSFSQKKLTFKMNRFILDSDSRYENPFLRNLHIGSLILLIDKNKREHLFLIDNIEYEIKEFNSVYTYSCQDAFSYQLIRQANGYTIVNDIKKENFIGAQNYSFWVNKILSECSVPYIYLDFDQALYRRRNGTITSVKSFDIEEVLKNPIHDSILQNNKFLFQTSNSNAKNALVELANYQDLNIVVYEGMQFSNGQRSNTLVRYIWFEYNKNPILSGFKYSPYKDVQSFRLTHAGNSLVSILNVKANKAPNGNLISLIPEPSSFILKILSSDKWKNTKDQYYSGLYRSLIEGKVFIGSKDKDGDFVFSQSETDFTLQFDYVFDSNYPIFSIANDSFIDNQTIYNNQYQVTLKKEGSDESFTFNQSGEIPQDFLDVKVQVSVNVGLTSKLNDLKKVVLNFWLKREVSKEEIDFITLAEKCPWLENKIINLDYFLRNKIISKNDYLILKNLLMNDLRILNGNLLVATKNYLNAIQNKNQIIKQITQDIDQLSSNVMANIIRPFETQGFFTFNSEFLTAYKDFFSTRYTKKALPLYSEILSQYANKCFQSQQLTLKSLYDFKKYFNSSIDLGTNKLYTVKINTTKRYKDFILFTGTGLQPITKDFFLYDKKTGKVLVDLFDIYTKEKIKVVDIETPNILEKKDTTTLKLAVPNNPYRKWKHFFYPTYEWKGDATPYTEFRFRCRENTVDYVSDIELIEIKENVDTNKTIFVFRPKLDTIANIEFLKRMSTVEQIYFEGYNTTWLTLAESTQLVWRELTLDELKKSILSRTTEYNLYVKDNIKKLVNADKSVLWTKQDFETNFFNYFKPEIFNTITESKITNEDCFQLYKDYFPLKEVYIDDYQVIKNEKYDAQSPLFEEKEQYWILNNMNQTFIDYHNFVQDLKNQKIKVSNPALSIKTFTIPVTNIKDYNYYYRNIDNTIVTARVPVSSYAAAAPVHEVSYTTYAPGLKGRNSVDIWGKAFSNVRDYNDSTTLNYTKDLKAFEAIKNFKLESQLRLLINFEYFKKINNTSLKYNVDNYQLEQVKENDTLIKKDYSTKSKRYFNYYSNVVFTYSSLQNHIDQDLYYKGSNWKVVSINDTLDPHKTYKAFDINAFMTTTGTFFETAILDGLLYYPIIANSKDFILPITTSQKFGDAPIKDWKIKENSTYIFIKDNTEYVWLEEEKNILRLATPEDYKKELYDNKGDLIQLENLVGIVDFFKWINEEDLYQKASIFDMKNDFFIKEEGKILPVYFIEQLIPADDVTPKRIVGEYNTTYYEETFLGTQSSIQIPIQGMAQSFYSFIKCRTNAVKEEELRQYFLSKQVFNIIIKDEVKEGILVNYTKTTDEDFLLSIQILDDVEIKVQDTVTISWIANSLLVEEVKQKTAYSEEINLGYITVPLNFENSRTNFSLKKKDLNNNWYASDVDIIIKFEDIENTSNGQFWYTYRNHIKPDALKSKALEIELELTRLWELAHNYSLLSNYFVPPHWFSESSDKINFYSSFIYQVQNIRKGDRITQQIVLLDNLIPKVQISNTIKKKEIIFYNDSNHNSLKELKDINVINDFVESANLSFEDWTYEWTEVDKEYYFVEDKNSGQLWSTFLTQTMKLGNNYSGFNGWDFLFLNILQNCYFSDGDLVLKKYKEAQKKKELFWTNLYSIFPGVLIENAYEDKYATDSISLYNSAEKFLRDHMQPEYQYDLNLIDVASLENYRQEPLHIGDSILLDALDYYSESDDLYDSLNKLLFISDISYTLRQDNDIKIQVNNIKYQDKVVERLANLIIKD